MSDLYNLAGKTILVDSVKTIGKRKTTVEETAGKITRISDAIYTEKNYGAVLSQIEAIASDGILTPNEREALQREWNGITSTYGSLVAQATKYGITSQTVYTNYVNAYTTLQTFLFGGSPAILPNDGNTVAVNATTMKADFSDYFTKESLLSQELFTYTTGLLDGLDDRTKVVLRLQSSAGLALSDGSTTLSAHIFVDNTEVTAQTDPTHQYLGGDLNPYDFEWTRTQSGWGRSQSDRRAQSISITESDLSNGTGTFYCVYRHYYSQTLFYYSNFFITVEKKITGDTGWSQATVTLYKRSQTAPVYDGGVLTYTFSTGGVAGDLGTWNRSVPSGSEPLYVISASAFANSATDTIPVNEWTTPAMLSENGTKGDDGYTVMTIILYQRGASAPARPTQTATYNFENRTISGVSPWTLDIPSGTDPIWVTVATASTRLSTLATDNIEPDEWAVVQKFVENGADGNGIQSISYFYKATTTQTAPSAGSITSTSIPTLSETDKYLWQKEVIDYTDEPDKTTVALIGVYGNTGDPGRGISSVTNYYKTNNSRTTAPTTGWVTTLQVPDETNPYLWNKAVISYSEGSDTESTPQIISQWIKGDPGTNGKNVIKFGSRSWTQAQINTICVAGYTDTWMNTDGVAVNSGDTVYVVMTNTTTGKSGMLYMKANGSCTTTSTTLNTTVVQYIKDGTDGDDGAYLNANASSLLIRDGEKSVLSTQASGTVTTKITANGSSVDYMKGISTITPFHLGKKRIRLVNLLKNATSSSYRSMTGLWAGEVDRINLQTDNPFSVDDKVYYRNYLNNPNSVSNNVYTRWQIYRSESDITGGAGNAINMGTSGSSSLLIPLTANYLSYNLLQFMINCDSGTSNTIEFKESLAINLTESGLIDYLALIGVTTDAQIKTWCDTYIPYFTGTFDIGGYLENLETGKTWDKSGSITKTEENDTHCLISVAPNVVGAHLMKRIYSVTKGGMIYKRITLEKKSGTMLRQVDSPNGGGWAYSSGGNFGGVILGDNPVTKYSFGVANESNIAVYAFYTGSNIITETSLTIDVTNSMTIDASAKGLYAFMSLLGFTTAQEMSLWMTTYLPFFSGTESMYNLLPSSVDVTFTSTDSLTQKVTVQYYAQKSDMGIGVTTPSNTVLRVFGVNPDTGEQMGTSFFRRNGALETVNTQSTVSEVTNDYTDFTFGASCTGGKYAIALYRPSNFYRPIVLEIHPDSNGTTAQILWRDLSGSTTDASGNTYSSTALIVGQFEYSGSQIIPDTIDMFASARELTGYLNGSFMEILGASTGNDPTLNVLAKAMGVERVFEKIAVLEAFVNHLFANTITMTGNGLIRSDQYAEDSNGYPTTGYRFTGIDGILKAYGGKFNNIHIGGESEFNGEITSTALTTTLEKAGGTAYSISLQSTAYWKYAHLQTGLDSMFTSDGYYSVSGSYAEVRRGTSNVRIASLTLRQGSRTSFTMPRTQRVIITTPCDCTMWVNGTGTYIYQGYTTKSFSKNDVIEFLFSDSRAPDQITIQITDINTDYSNKYAFFNSSGAVYNPSSTYTQGSISVTYGGNTYTPPALYRWNGMATASGGGQTQSGGTLTLTSEDGGTVLSGASLYSVYWSSASLVKFTTSNISTYSIDTSTYYRALSSSFTVKSQSNSVQSVSITPKNSSTDSIGNQNNKFHEIWGTSVYGAVFN